MDHPSPPLGGCEAAVVAVGKHGRYACLPQPPRNNSWLTPQPSLRGSLGLTESHGDCRRGDVAQQPLYALRVAHNQVVVAPAKTWLNKRDPRDLTEGLHNLASS